MKKIILVLVTLVFLPFGLLAHADLTVEDYNKTKELNRELIRVYIGGG
jgi:hypothetical protein